MDQSVNDDSEQLSIRIDKGLPSALQSLAEESGMKRNAYINHILRLAVERGTLLRIVEEHSDKSTTNTISVKGGGTVKDVTQGRNVGKKRKKPK